MTNFSPGTDVVYYFKVKKVSKSSNSLVTESVNDISNFEFTIHYEKRGDGFRTGKFNLTLVSFSPEVALEDNSTMVSNAGFLENFIAIKNKGLQVLSNSERFFKRWKHQDLELHF
ncbi:MAG: hypothetical protein ABWZ25_18630 [Chitinophagaceae bacterium]